MQGSEVVWSVKRVERALGIVRHVPKNMGIDHGRLHVLVAEKALHFPDIDARLKQMRRKAVTEGVDRSMLRYAHFPHRIFDSLLDRVVTDMMSAHPAAPWIDR